MLAWVLGTIFVFAGAGKLTDSRRTVQAFENLSGGPSRFAKQAGYLLPIVELCIGALLIPARTRWIAAAAAVLLLSVFLAVIAVAYHDGISADCNCFGRAKESRVGEGAIVRNIVLLLLGVSVLALSRLPMTTAPATAIVGLLLTSAVAAAAAAVVASSRRKRDRPASTGSASPFRWALEE